MATLMKHPELDKQPATGRNSNEIGLLRTAAVIASALCVVTLVVGTDLYISLVLGLLGAVLAAWDARTSQGMRAGRQVLVFSIVALMAVLLIWVAVYLLGLWSPLVYLLALILGVGAWVALYLAGYLQARKPELEREQAGAGVATSAKQQNPRLLLAAGALLTGLSIAIPAIMMAFGYPLNGSQYICCERRGPYGEPWVGETWWPLVFAAMALSIGCGITGIVLAARSRGFPGGATEAQSAKASHSVVRRANWLLSFAFLSFALLTLVLAPIMTLYATSPVPDDYAATQVIKHWINLERLNFGMGGAFISLGLVGIVLAVWGVTASDPAVSRKWFLPFAVTAFPLAIVGNALMFLLFMLIGFWL